MAAVASNSLESYGDRLLASEACEMASGRRHSLASWCVALDALPGLFRYWKTGFINDAYQVPNVTLSIEATTRSTDSKQRLIVANNSEATASGILICES